MAETVGKVLYTEEQIKKRAKEVGKQITKDFAGEEVLLVGTLKGSIFWMVDVAKNIDLDVKFEFIIVGSYGSNTTSAGIVTMKKDVDSNLAGRNVIIMEDIVDSGVTLDYLIKHFQAMNPKSIKVCTMLNKMDRRSRDVQVDYMGFDVDNLFIVGYGLDYDQKYRNLPYISYLQE